MAVNEKVPGRPDDEGVNYRTLIESLNHVVFTLDEAGRFTYLSPGCHAILGLRPEELQGRPITSIIAPGDRDRLCLKFRTVLQGESYPSDYQVIDTGGKIHPVRAVSRVFTDERGVTGVIGAISELDNWQIAEEALRQSEEKVKRIVECSHDGVLLVDESGAVVEWNPALERMTGFSRSGIVGRKIWEVQYDLLPDSKKTPEHAEQLKGLFLSALSGANPESLEQSYEHIFQHRDKSIRNIESFLFPVPGEQGMMIGGILRDISDRKKTETALQEANRKLNLLSSITRHDINNQLTVFNGYLSLLEAGSPAMKKEDIIRILQGAGTKIQRILKFTRDYQDVGVKAPAWQILSDTIAAAKTTIDTRAVRFPPGCLCTDMEILADPMLARVFSNLIDNSLRHGEKVTEIRIDCRREDDRLVIVYQDDGIGIPDKVRPVLFEQGKGKNTGYGMFLIREILAITGFTISETGAPGTGARFEIIVPEGSFRARGKAEHGDADKGQRP